MSRTNLPVLVIAPNLKRRWSGVTSTVFRLVPLQARRMSIVCIGPDLPTDMPQITWPQLLALPRRERRVWHARRNIEMLAGIILRRVFRKNLALVFTSAAQRRHTGYTRWLIRQMDRVIATSRASAGYLDVPSRVIMHGINCDRFTPAEDRAALRAELGLPEAAFLVGCFGRVREQKGTDIFVRAMIDAARNNPDLVGVVIGQTTSNNEAFLDALRTEVSNAGLQDRILFLGEQPDAKLPSFFASMDLFIAPQRWEGFGLTPIEAMASGVPVLASTAGAFSEMIIEGETGHIIDPMTPKALAEAICTAATDRERLALMGRNARTDVVERFNIEREATEIEAVYRDLLPRQSANVEADSV